MLRRIVPSLVVIGCAATALAAQHADHADRHPAPRTFTPAELEAPTTKPNPFLSFLPAEDDADWAFWRARLQHLGTLRPGRLVEADVVALDEAELVDDVGINDLSAVAQPIPGFASLDGRAQRARIHGTLEQAPIPFAGAQPGDAIPSALVVPLETEALVVIEGVVGDSPFGSTGLGTGDFDFFRVSIAAGETLRIRVRTPEPLEDLDPILGLYTADGGFLGFNDNLPLNGFVSNFDAFFDYTAAVDEDVVVVVGGNSPLAPFQDEEEMLPADPFDPASGPGAFSEGPYELALARDLADRGDRDAYRVELRAGDVVGAVVDGNGTRVGLLNANDQVLVRARFDITGIYPSRSPLPGGGNAAFGWVVERTGAYAVFVEGTDPMDFGGYTLTVGVHRARLDKVVQPVRQRLFLDFDGATVPAETFNGTAGETLTLSPLRAFLDGWGLSIADEGRVIDAIVAVVETRLDAEVRARGGNGDFAADGIPGHFDIEITNSRHHRDPFGEAHVSRIIVGGTVDELGRRVIGTAQSIDPGNAETGESAVVLLDLLSEPDLDSRNSLNAIPRAPGVGILEVIASGVGAIVSHEAGHLLGNFHTRRDGNPQRIMDRGGNLPGFLGLGFDGVFGTTDDRPVELGADVYSPAEVFDGREEALEVVSFGLPAGGPRPAIALERQRADFGPQPVGSFVQKDISVSNEGSEPLVGTIAILPATGAPGSGAFSISDGGGAFALAPGTQLTLRIAFSPPSPGSFAAVVAVTSNDGDEPDSRIALTGQGGVPMAAVAPRSLDFGSIVYGDADQSVPAIVELRNDGDGDLAVAGVVPVGRDAAAFEAPDQPFVLGPGARRDVEVAFAPGGLVGDLRGFLRIVANDPDADARVGAQGTAIGPDIAFVPAVGISFGNVDVGTEEPRTAVVENLGSTPLQVDRLIIESSGPGDFAVLSGAPPFALEPGGRQDLSLRFSPTDEGVTNAALLLFGNDPDERPLRVPLVGAGVRAQIVAEPERIRFPSVPVGATVGVDLRVANEGSGELLVDLPSFSGSGASAFSTNPAAAFFLASDDERILRVRFSPPASGPFFATLTLASNDPGRPELEILVFGVGLDP